MPTPRLIDGKCQILLRALVVATLALVFAPVAMAQDIYVRSQAGVSPAQVKAALPGFTRGAADVRRWWGGPPTTLLYGKAPPGAWQITIKLGTNPFIGGYHSINPWGVPYAVVFVDYEWQLILSHELEEMLVDPYVDRTAQGDRLYLVEVADPVEQYSYKRLGVTISDFVGPDWYRGGRYFDFMHRCTSAHQLLPGGFLTYWDGTDWAQEFN